MDDAVGREAESALETVELRKGGHCGSCLDCRQGLGAGKESLETLATILKGISCCAGDVSHNVYRCRACGRYYLSTFFDHSDSGHGQFYVYAISENDARAIVDKIRGCPSSLDRRCGCDVHAGFLKDETVPVDKELRYSEGDK